jgi:HK97 family phage major capsid protein
MNRYLALKQERIDLNAEAQKLDLGSDEGKTRFAEITAKVNEVDAALLLEDQRREMERTAPAVAGHVSNVRDLAGEKPWGYIVNPDKPEKFALGDWLHSVVMASRGNVDPRLMIGAVTGMSSGVQSEGGYLMPLTMSNQIMARMTQGALLSRLNPLPLDSSSDTLAINVLDEVSRATGSRKGGVRSYWISEGEAPTASKPAFARIELKLRKVGCLGYATDELLRNVSALQGWFVSFFADEIRFAVEDAIVNGTGAGQPMGVLNFPCLVTAAKETGQAADTIVKENIDKMWTRLYGPSRSNAVWFINQQIEPQLNSMTMPIGTGGVPVYLPAGGLAASPYGVLYGRPVVPVEYCQALGDAGDIILADFSEYAWIQEGGVDSASSIHVAFTTFEQAFRASWRVDGQPTWRAALTPYKGTANTLSPFVTLAAR